MVESRTVGADEAELRLDRWFRKHFPELPHARLQRLLRTGQVRVDGRRAEAGLRLSAGQTIRLPPLDTVPAPTRDRQDRPVDAATAERLQAAVLFRDDWVIGLDKPAGLAVQGGSGQHQHLDGLLDTLRFEAAERPRLVHRLDRDTAGVLLLARTAQAARRLTQAFKQDEARKTYWALVSGRPTKPRGVISAALGKRQGPAGEKVVTDEEGGKPAVTRWARVASVDLPGRQQATWLALRPLTGRTHQLRVHCAALGHSILGDGKYGGKAAFGPLRGLPQQMMLLAREIAVPHPEDGTTLRVEAPLPPHMAAAFAAFRFAESDTAAVQAADWLEG